MEAMIRRCIKVRNPIKKALIEMNLDYMWNNEYIKIAEILLLTLEPIRITIENLSRDDLTLSSAEAALKFLFTNLEKLNTERRDKTIVSFIKFLHNPEFLQKDSKDAFFH